MLNMMKMRSMISNMMRVVSQLFNTNTQHLGPVERGAGLKTGAMKVDGENEVNEGDKDDDGFTKVVTTLKKTALPVTEVAFPTVTICASGFHMANVEKALSKNFGR